MRKRLNYKLLNKMNEIEKNVSFPLVSLKPLTQTSYSSSFGLIEVLITAAIFILFITALVTLSGASNKGMVVSKHRLQASNLAKEGAERIKQRNYTNLLGSSVPWNTGLPVSVSSQYQLTYDLNNKQWQLVNGTETVNLVDNNASVQYTRTITYTDPSTYVRKFNVTVTWSDFDRAYSVTESTYISNRTKDLT